MLKKSEAINMLRNKRMLLQDVEQTLDNIIKDNIEKRKDSDKSPIEIPIVNDDYCGNNKNVVLNKNAGIAKKILEDGGYNPRNIFAPNNTCIKIDWFE